MEKSGEKSGGATTEEATAGTAAAEGQESNGSSESAEANGQKGQLASLLPARRQIGIRF